MNKNMRIAFYALCVMVMPALYATKNRHDWRIHAKKMAYRSWYAWHERKLIRFSPCTLERAKKLIERKHRSQQFEIIHDPGRGAPLTRVVYRLIKINN